MAVLRIESEPENVKRFYMDKGVTFKKNCPKCGKPVSIPQDMFEYPLEGATIYFECEDCEFYFDVKLKCIGGTTSFDFELPKDVEIE